jgi:hypothetical protein
LTKGVKNTHGRNGLLKNCAGKTGLDDHTKRNKIKLLTLPINKTQNKFKIEMEDLKL